LKNDKRYLSLQATNVDVASTCDNDSAGAVGAKGLPAARLLHVELQIPQPHQEGGICGVRVQLVQVKLVR